MEREKEQWVEKALNSLDGIQAAVPSAGMHRSIMQRIQPGKLSIAPDRVRMGTIYRAAAAILIIVAMNVFTCIAFTKNTMKEKQLQSFAKQFSISDTNDSFLNI